MRDRADIYNNLKETCLICIKMRKCVREIKLCEYCRDQNHKTD